MSSYWMRSKKLRHPSNGVVVVHNRVNYGANHSRITPKMFKKYSQIKPDGTFTVVGTARCSKNDVPDTTFGSHLAESRAKTMAFAIAHNVCLEILNDVKALAYTLSDSIIRFENLKQSTYNHVKKLEEQAND